MKNIRGDHPTSHNYLGSKRSSLNHDKLPQPYKIEWGTSQFKNADNRSSSSKNFFQNMKEQLSSIKNDFEKLIKKQNSFSSAAKPIKEESLYSTGIGFGSGNKGKSLSSYKKDHKKYGGEKVDESDKMEFIMNLQKMEENNEKYYTYEMPESFSQKKGITKTVNTKESLSTNPLHRLQNRLFEEKQEKIQSEMKVQKDHVIDLPEREIQKKEEGHEKLKKQIYDLSSQVKSLKQQKEELATLINSLKQQKEDKGAHINSLKQQKEEMVTFMNTLKQQKEEIGRFLSNKNQQFLELRQQKQKLIEKMTQLSTQLQNKMNYAMNQQTKITQLNHQLEEQHDHHSKHIELVNEEIEKERVFYKEKINQLLFHNEHFDKINMELGTENQHLKENLENMHHFVQQLKKINQNTENDYKRKLQFMKKDVEQYQKRETMLERQMQRLNLELRNAVSEPQQYIEKSTNIQSENEIEQLKGNIDSLQIEIKELSQQLKIEKETVLNLKQKYQEEVQKSNLEDFKNTVEKNMNYQVEENAKLKTKINSLEAQIDSLKEQKRSFIKEIELYEQREKGNKNKNQMTSSQWEELTEKIQILTEENQTLKQKLELRVLKEDVQRQENSFKIEKDQNIVKLAFLQLQQIQKMKNQIKNIKSQNDFLRRELEVQGETCLNLKAQLKNNEKQSKKNTDQKHCCFIYQTEMLERKNVQLNSLKRLIFKIIIEKTGKREDEIDIQFWLRKIEELRPILTDQ